jgi:hypothetical protein
MSIIASVTEGRLLELPAQVDVRLHGVAVRAHSLCQTDQQPDGELVRRLGKPPEGLFVQHEELRRLFRRDRRSRDAAREQRQLADGLTPVYVRERRASVIQFHTQQARDHDIDAQIRLTPPQQALARFELQQPGARHERVEDLVAGSLQRLKIAQHGDAHP